jgi:hypothetical protein
MTSFLGRAIALAATLGILFLMTGCGLVGAMANPKVAWAINDPAPMTVVVRRADAAEATAKQVDRLLMATPASPDSDWLKNVGPTPDYAAQDMKALTQDPMSDLQSTDGSAPSLLAIVSTDLAAQYKEITDKEQEIATLETQIAAEKKARDAKGVSDADKKAHDKNVDDLKAQKSKKEDEVDPLKKKFLAACKDASTKTPSDARDAVAPALVNLRQAVEDATISDGAAAVRYPLAMPGMTDAIKQQVPVIVADIIEEQTGKRPSMQGLQPGITLDGMTPNITLNGLGKDDLGKISIGDLTAQTVVRTKDWIGHVLGLLGSIAATKTELSFEEDTIDSLLDGFAKNGWKRIDPVKIPEATDPKVLAATPKIRPHQKPQAPAAAPAVGVASSQPANPPATAPTTPPAKGAKAAPSAKTAGSKKPTSAPTAAPAPPSGPAAPMRPEDFNP